MIGEAVDRARVAQFAIYHGVEDIYQGAVPALLPFFVAERHYSYAAAAGLTFAMSAMSSVIQPLFGALTDRYNLFWLAPAGLIVTGIGVGLSGLVTSYPLTWLVIALSGVGVAAFHPEAARAARAAAGNSQRAMSVFSAGGNVGLAIGPLFTSGVLIAIGTSGTVFLAVPALATSVVFFFVLSRRGRLPAPRGAHRQGTRSADDWHGFALLTSVVVVRSIVFFGLASLLALYVGTGLHGGKQIGELALTTLLAAGTIGTVSGGWLADRFGRVRVTRASFALTTLGLLAVVLSPLPWVFLSIAITGFMLFQSFSLTMTLGQDYLPSRIGTSSGVTLGLAISVGGILTPLLGALADATSLHLAVAVLLVLPPAALAIALQLREPRPIAPPAHAPAVRASSPIQGCSDSVIGPQQQ